VAEGIRELIEREPNRELARSHRGGREIENRGRRVSFANPAPGFWKNPRARRHPTFFAVNGVIYAIGNDGLLRWYRYDGTGQQDPTGSTGWAPNSGNQIGNGWTW